MPRTVWVATVGGADAVSRAEAGFAMSGPMLQQRMCAARVAVLNTLAGRRVAYAAVLRRLGVNLLYLVPRQVGGTEIYARRLVAGLAQELPDTELLVFCGAEAPAVFPDPEWPASVRVVRAPVRAASKALRLATELV